MAMQPALSTVIAIATGVPGTEFGHGRIFLEIPAIVFGQWAAHPAHNGKRGIADTTGPENPEDGWAVTHVPTGLEVPAPLLWEDEAINIAMELRAAGVRVRVAGNGISDATSNKIWTLIVAVRNTMHPAGQTPEFADVAGA